MGYQLPLSGLISLQYKRICRKLQDKSFPAQVAFLVSVEPIFKNFLCLFQNEGPLIHLLRDQIMGATKIGNASFSQEPRQ